MEDQVDVKHNPNDTEVQQMCHESDSTDPMETSFCGEEHSMANGYQEVTYIKTEEPDCDLEQVVVKEEFCDLRHELQDNEGGGLTCEEEEEVPAAGAPSMKQEAKGGVEAENSCFAHLRSEFSAREDVNEERCEGGVLEKQIKSSKSPYRRSDNVMTPRLFYGNGASSSKSALYHTIVAVDSDEELYASEDDIRDQDFVVHDAEDDDTMEIEDYDELEDLQGPDTVVIEIEVSNTGASKGDRAVSNEIREKRGKMRNLQRNWKTTTNEEESQTPLFTGSHANTFEELFSPLKYFSVYFDDDILNVIVEQSNLYALQKDVNKPLGLSKEELQKWIGLLVYFSISKLPNTRMHWAKKLSPFTDFAAECMSRDRFEAIKSNLHLADNTLEHRSGHARDPFFKVRPLINHLRGKFQQVEKQQNLCVDAQKIFGYKIFVLTDDKGFTYDFIPYTGKILPVNDPEIPDLKPSSNIVLHLAQTIPAGENFLLFFDNWFTSVQLLHHLATRAIWCCGTVRLPRLPGLPKDMKDDKRLMKKERGSYEERVLTQDEVDITLVRWRDNKIVNLVSTFAKAQPVTSVSRFDRKEKKAIDVPYPDIVKRYNTSMGGVDLADQLLALYRIPVRSKKNYHRLIFHFIDMAMVNSWLLYRRHADDMSLTRKDILCLAEFKLVVANSLMKLGKSCEPLRRGRPPVRISNEDQRRRFSAPSNDVRLDKVAHVPYIHQKRNRCKNNDCQGRTNVYCKKCNANLCLSNLKNCFATYHGH